MANRQSNETKERVNCSSETFVRDSLPAAFRLWAKRIGLEMECCIPAIVAEYDRAEHVAIVNPLIKHTAKDGQVYDRAPKRVSVWRWQTGGFLIDVPVFKGDTGWIVACDRDSTNAKAANGEIQDKRSGFGPSAKNANKGAQPVLDGDGTTHAYTCGFFIPDKWGRIELPKDAEDSLVLEQIGRDGKSAGRFLLSQDGVLTFESDKTDGKVVIDPSDLDGKEARFRVKRAVVGLEDDNLKVRQSRVLSTESEEAENIPLEDVVRADELSISFAKDEERGERYLQFLNFQGAAEKGTTLADELKKDKDGDYHVIVRKKVSGKWMVMYLKAGHGLGDGGGGGATADLHTIDYKGHDQSLELAEFQNDNPVEEDDKSRIDSATIVSDVNDVVNQEVPPEGEDPKTDVDFQILVRKTVGGVKKLYYKALGLFVTGIKPGDGDDRDAKVGVVSVSAAWQDDSKTDPSVDFDNTVGKNGVVVKFPKPKDSTQPAPDEKSLSRQSGGDGAMEPTNFWSIKGFGKFSAGGSQSVGTFSPSVGQDIEIVPRDDSSSAIPNSGMAFVVREGDKNEDNANSVGYKRIRVIKNPSPFEYVKTYNEQGILTATAIVNCKFVFDGVETSATPDPFTWIPTTGKVYLVSKGTKPSESGTRTWTHTVQTSVGTAEEGGKIINIPLYEFANGKVAVDYRASFLTVDSGAEAAEEWGNPEAALVDPPLTPESQPTATVEVVEKTETEAKHLKFTFGIPPGKAGDKGDDGNDAVVDVSTEEIDKGTKVTLTPNNGGTPASFDVMNGSDGADGKSIGSVEQRAGTGQNPGDTTTVDVKDEDGKTIGSFTVQSGTQGDKGDPGPMPDGMGVHNLSVESNVITTFIAANGVNIRQISLSAGNGISLSVQNGVVTISADPQDQDTQGYTTPEDSPRQVVLDSDYDQTTHTLKKLVQKEHWIGGRLDHVEPPEWKVYHTAVEETV